jgi:hypothetical protein
MIHPTLRAASFRERAIAANVSISSSVNGPFDCLLPSCHLATPLSIGHKREIHERVSGFITARLMESMV